MRIGPYLGRPRIKRLVHDRFQRSRSLDARPQQYRCIHLADAGTVAKSGRRDSARYDSSMGATGAVYLMTAFAVVILIVIALPLAWVRRWWPLFWRVAYEDRPRPAAALQIISAWAGGVFAVLVVILVTWDGAQDLAPEEAASPEHYISLGVILGGAVALLGAVARHERRRRRGETDDPTRDAAINATADRARVPTLILSAIAAAVGLAVLMPWSNGIDRIPGAAQEERAEPQDGLVDVITITPARIDDLGDGRIRINYLGYRQPACDRLAGAVITESADAVTVSVQLGHPRASGGCSFARSMLLSGTLETTTHYHFEEQLESPVGDRTVRPAP